ncbi:DUF5686 family protein [uncultured Mesonia sp.]|uniref:DUF5686 family protein n=1 Tax=uncultured Mesonia sp. TaxID=399731 RepID=UPI00374F9A28
MHRFTFLYLLLLVGGFAHSQHLLRGKIVSQEDQTPIPYARIEWVNQDQTELSNIDGSFNLNVSQKQGYLKVSYLGYISKKIKISSNPYYLIQLEPDPEKLEEVFVTSTQQLAQRIINKSIQQKAYNDPDLKFKNYSYNNYLKLIIDNQKANFKVELDTTNTSVSTILNQGRAYLTEEFSNFEYTNDKGLQEKILGTRTAGFKQPVFEMLSLNIQSPSWYKEKYTVFGNDYAGPLAKNPFRNYRYKVLDTTQSTRPAYVIYFQPKRQKTVASLEGLLYIDTLNYGLQKAVGQLKGELEIEATQNFTYLPEQDIWFPVRNEILLKPGTGGKKVSIFGGSISLGSLTSNKSNEQAQYLQAISTNSNWKFNSQEQLLNQKAAISLSARATERNTEFWHQNRSIPYTSRDQRTFTSVERLIEKQHIDRKINLLQNFNIGYLPIGFFNLDLRTLVKYNDYEGFRLGAGGVTNQNFAKRFRIDGYSVYGFKDRAFKYKIGAGYQLNPNKNTWLNLSYINDIEEIGTFKYLTDARVYSLFEPRLVNINFYFKYESYQANLQHQIAPSLLSEFKVAKTNINQTGGYRYIDNQRARKAYDITAFTASFRYSPKSTFLQAPNKNIEVEVGYPQFSFQVERAIKGILNGDYNYTKLGLKMQYTIERITQVNTEFIAEANAGFGDLPLTHTFHAFPNSPNKATIMNRFSVAGRRTFETMYFSEFFSDKQASLQIKHKLRPFTISQRIQPQLVFISRHAIGDFEAKDRHLGVRFNTLNKGYHEAGIELNNILFGFGLNFAYRYGAYHLPQLEENISLKFTFYFKL